MNKNIRLFLLSLVVATVVACGEDKKDTVQTASSTISPELEHDLRLYETAKKRDDMQTAVYAINSILLRDSTRTGLVDTLFRIYLMQENYAATDELGEKLITLRPNDAGLLDTVAVINTYVGKFDAAVEKLNKSYSIRKDIKTLHHLADVYLAAQNAEKAIETLNLILQDKTGGNELIEQPMASVPNRTQKVKLTAITYLKLATVYASMKDKKTAIKYAEKALESEPNFDYAATFVLELKYGKKQR